MIKTNYHMHSTFSDGKAEPEEYVKTAIRKRFESIGFSEHGPTKFAKHWELLSDRVGDYIREIKRLKEKYAGQIEIYTGLEIDYYTGVDGHVFTRYELDYRLGSIHYFPDEEGKIFGIDCKREEFLMTFNDYFKGDARAMVKEYYSRIISMAYLYSPDIIGHFDLIKINNQDEMFFKESDSWYGDDVMEALEFISGKGTMLDVNTGGITRGFISEPYPSPWILKEAARLNIPVVLNSDAHTPENIDGNFELVTNILIASGYKSKMILSKGKWKEVSLI